MCMLPRLAFVLSGGFDWPRRGMFPALRDAAIPIGNKE
jgi:hypothetical protein